MASAFSTKTRSSEDHVDVKPPDRHIVPYMTGGLKTLLHRVKTKDIPRQPASGYFTSKDGHFELKGPCMIGGRFVVIKVLDTNGQSAVLVLAEDVFDQEKLVVIKVLHSQFYQIGIQESHILARLAAIDPLNNSHTLRLLSPDQLSQYVINVFHSQFYQIGIQESHILARLAAIDPLNNSHTLRLLTTVMCDSHYCLVFEPLLPDPLTTVFADLPQQKVLPNIRKVGLRLLASIGFLHHHNMIHTDLKPENLLLRDEYDLDSVHIVDFGNTLQYVHSELSLYYKDFELQTPLYRAPEVLFGVPFGTEIDMWSLGCILAELYLGEALFFGYSILDIIGKMKSILGPFPSKLFRKGKYYRKYQEFTGDQEPTNNTLMLMESLQCKDVMFADLLSGLLQYDPSERLTASDAACHPFFSSHFPMAFLMPLNAGNVRSSTNGLCPQSCPSSPCIAPDVSRRQPTSLELLRLGTSELPDMNETYILKPSPKVGTVKRRAATENMSDSRETSEEEVNSARDEGLPGCSDMSVVRNLVHGKNKKNFSRSVKEKMSDLLKAIREEQDVVEADLDKKSQTQQQRDRYFDKTRINLETVHKDTREPWTEFVSPRVKKTKNRPTLIQPCPKYGKVWNENNCVEEHHALTEQKYDQKKDKYQHYRPTREDPYDGEQCKQSSPSEKDTHNASKVKCKKVLSAYEIHRHLEPSCAQSSTCQTLLIEPSPVFKNEKIKESSPVSSSELDRKNSDKRLKQQKSENKDLYTDSYRLPHKSEGTILSPSHLVSLKREDKSKLPRAELQAKYMRKKERCVESRATDMEFKNPGSAKEYGSRLHSKDKLLHSNNMADQSPNQLMGNITYDIKDENGPWFEQKFNAGREKPPGSKREISDVRTDDAGRDSDSNISHKSGAERPYRPKPSRSIVNGAHVSYISDEEDLSGEGRIWFDDTLNYGSVNSSKNRSRSKDRSGNSSEGKIPNSKRHGFDGSRCLLSGNSGRSLDPGIYRLTPRSVSSNSTITYHDSQSSDEQVELMSPEVLNVQQMSKSHSSHNRHYNPAGIPRERDTHERKRHIDQLLCSPRYQKYNNPNIKPIESPAVSQDRVNSAKKDHKRNSHDIYNYNSKERNTNCLDVEEKDRKRNIKRKLELPHEVENTYVVPKMSQGKKRKSLNYERTCGLMKSNSHKEDDLMVSKDKQTNRKLPINSACIQQNNSLTDRYTSDQVSRYKSRDATRWHSNREEQPRK